MLILRVLVTVFLMVVGLLAGSIAWATFYAGERHAIGGMISSGYGALIQAKPERLWFLGGVLGAAIGALVSKAVFSTIENADGGSSLQKTGPSGQQAHVSPPPANSSSRMSMGHFAAGMTAVPPVQSQPPMHPNLIDCPDCGHRVSRRAVNCPSCGCPISTSNPITPQIAVSCPHCRNAVSVDPSDSETSNLLQCPICSGYIAVEVGGAVTPIENMEGDDESK